MFSLLIFFMTLRASAETTYLFENYFFYSNNILAETVLNPDNRLLQMPSQVLAADLRAELKWRGEQNQVVVRPRYQAEKNVIISAGLTAEENESDWDLTDAFWETQVKENFSLTTGLQVYQWGPAELMNPSNPLFHFNSRQKSFGYKEKGKVLVRGNYTFGRFDNFVLIAEPVSNNESPWAEGEFVPKALLKYEHQSEESASQIGAVAGQEEKNKRYLGSYFSWQVSEAFSIYADAKTTEKEIGFRPEQTGIFWNLVTPASQRDWPVLAVSGLRWEGDFDVRAEYLYNSAGFTEEEWAAVLSAVANPLNPNYLSNIVRFQNLGLELPGKQYLYFSYRVNEPFENKDLNIYLRDLYSLQDYSSQIQFEFDKAISDAVMMFGNVTATAGRKEAEFRLLNTWQMLLGVKWVL